MLIAICSCSCTGEDAVGGFEILGLDRSLNLYPTSIISPLPLGSEFFNIRGHRATINQKGETRGSAQTPEKLSAPVGPLWNGIRDSYGSAHLSGPFFGIDLMELSSKRINGRVSVLCNKRNSLRKEVRFQKRVRASLNTNRLCT